MSVFFRRRGIAKVTYKKYSINYLWNKYNVNSNTTYTEQVTDANYEYTYSNTGRPAFAGKVNQYSYITYNNEGYYYIGNADYEAIAVDDEDLSGITLFIYRDATDLSDGSQRSKYLIKNATTTYVGYNVQDGKYRNRVNGKQYEVVSNTTHSKGTYIGTVTASSRSAYPTNGTSDNTYWYVYQGTIKGEEIGTIEGLPGEYPEDGVQGGYWYVRQ